MTAVGPVCHIPPVTAAGVPPPQALQAVPPAQPNIASLTATVNALRQLVLVLAGLNGQAGANGQAGKAAPAGSWTQKSIQTEQRKIFQNNDPSTGNFVEVQVVTELVMANNATKQTWTYKAPPAPGQ